MCSTFRLTRIQQGGTIDKITVNPESLRKLLREQLLPVTHGYKLAVSDPLDLRCMRIGNLPAANDSNLKRRAPSVRQLSKNSFSPSVVDVAGTHPSMRLILEFE